MLKLFLRLIIYVIIWVLIEKLFKLNYKAEAWGTIFVGFEAAFIGLTQLRNTRDSLEIDLFMQFNDRYSKLNEDLKRCFDKQLTTENVEEDNKIKKILEAYLNLCCEEYYCYRVKKQIPFHIWKFWHAGIMFNWHNCQCLKDFWENEYSNANSFYISNGDYPFKMEAIKKNNSFFYYCFERIERCFY